MGGESVLRAATKVSPINPMQALEVDIRKFQFTKHLEDPQWFLDVDELQTGKVPIGWSIRLTWFQA